MDRSYYLDLAAGGLRMPIGTDLFVKPKPDHERHLLDGELLGADIIEAARHFDTPLGLTLMDLRVEKEDLLTMLGIPPADIDTWHFETRLDEEQQAALAAGLEGPPTPRMRANAEALNHVAERSDLVPVGMCIGPFSLMTKLVTDPIIPVYLAGTGLTGDDDPEVGLVEELLAIAVRVIERGIRHQLAAGARAICLCEPAANTVFLSPNQLEEDWGLFTRMVMEPNRHLRSVLAELGVDLVFHDCGELLPEMVRDFATLDPAILSLGSPVDLPAVAPLVGDATVLFGNLPSKKFYSDGAITGDRVAELSRELLAAMEATGHPFILGTECDVLSVPGCDEVILEKVHRMLTA